ncbi:MAG: hypothetical protein HQM10_13190 [Candidatus Riflebacteria bacterium]|nr:hypothetical protein [Candidatus Riflebacteria bacterium]
MRNYFILIMCLVLIFPQAGFSLDSRYERNGEAYLLIGDGIAGKRGVYRLNNPSGELSASHFGGDKSAFDPGNSRGLNVDLERKVFTFTQHTDPGYMLDTKRKLSRLMKKEGDCTLFGAHVETRQHYPVDISVGYPTLHDSDGTLNGQTAQGAGQPVYTTKGSWGNWGGVSKSLNRWISWGDRGRFVSTPGSWVSGVYNGKWADDSGNNPVRTQKDPRTGYEGWWYEAYCCYPNTYWYPGGAAFWLYWVPINSSGYGTVPNDSWWQSRDRDPGNRPGNMFYWDRLWEQRVWYDLKNWVQSRDGFGIDPYGKPVIPGETVQNIDYTAREYLVRYRISACINCVCVNGGGGSLTEPTPKYISIALSPFGRTYQYSRSVSAKDAQLKLNGSEVALTNANIRGDPNDLTTKWVGISAKSKTEEFIYLLGNKFFRDCIPGLPGSFDATSVSVSDQWNLQGGIIFAYDKNTGFAYQIFRNDKDGGNAVTAWKTLNLGGNIDDLKSDGFGNVYFTRTVLNPADDKITISNVVSFAKTGGSYRGQTPGILYYNQNVDKTAFKRETGASSDTSIGKVNLGINRFYRRFIADDTIWTSLTLANLAQKSALSGWIWSDSSPKPPSVRVNEPDAIQLAVINVGTPPHPENTGQGKIDICGPASQSYLMTDKYDQGVYSFKVENAPKWLGDDNVVLPGKDGWVEDQSGNAFTGGFCSSLVNTNPDSVSRSWISPEVLYNWKVIRIQDAIGIATRTDCIEKVNYTRNRLSYYFTPGAYEIHCSAKYKWYDYDSLPFGSTIQNRASAIRPTGGDKYQQCKAKGDYSAFSSILGFVGPTNTANTAVQVIRIKEGPPPPTGDIVPMQQAKATSSPVYNFPTPITLAAPIGKIDYFVATQAENMLYRISPASISLIWDLPQLKTKLSDINMVDTTLEWTSDAQFTWIYDVAMPDGSAGPSTTITKSLTSNVNPEISLALNMPTDPSVGTITCQLLRTWHYFRNVYTYDPDTEERILLDPVEIMGELRYRATSRILVLDNEAPKIVSVNGFTSFPKNPILLGNTWGLVTESLSWSGYSNPDKFSILVRDNNPFANSNSTLAISGSKHNRGSKTKAAFSFERKNSKELFPSAAGAAMNWYSSPPPSVLSDGSKSSTYKVVRTPQSYTRGATFSEVLYELALADWVHVQDNTSLVASDACNRWPWDMANNSPTYRANGQLGAPHPGYALFFIATDSSGIGMTRGHLGNVWIKDNLLPVPYTIVNDYAKNVVNEKVPYNIDSWLKLYHKLAIANTWAVDKSGVFVSKGTITPVADSNVIGIPRGLVSEMTIPYHPPKFEEGMEVFFAVSATDNINVASNTGNTSNEPRIVINGPIAGGIYQTDTAKAPTPATIDSDNTPSLLRAILQYPGVYNCTISAQDNAVDFSGNPAPNKRTIEFGIVVSPVDMDVRILEQKNEKF